ncbi:MAG: type I-E CRISPR-associated endoribonuclease Cas2 [Armatimonadetes bacterium]|nr:type I-E CRISPR-associated endoribonuclease Cas2 [Armatimonadota bacterium]
MVVLVMTAVKPSLRGQLSRWMIEVSAGVFVGALSARVRDGLWDIVTEEAGEGSAALVYTADTEQGFAIRVCGDPDREPVDYDGITLMRFKTKAKR